VNDNEQRITALSDVSIYTANDGELIPLMNVFLRMAEQGDVLKGIYKDEQLRQYFLKVMPEHDTRKVYVSELKKILNWYWTLFPHLNDGEQQVNQQ
jgi:hypothetical protein